MGKIEEIKKWLEEECENHPDMKEKVKKVEEKIKAKKASLLKTDDDDLDDFLKVLGKQFTDKVEEVKAKIEEAKQGNKKSLLQTDDDTKMGDGTMGGAMGGDDT